jgi:hemolysin activation/secretion protein
MNGWLRHAAALGCLLPGLASCPGWTQPVPGQRPGDSRPELPTFEPPAVQPGAVLPLVTPPVESGIGHPGETLFVREIRISGNTVLEPAQLDALTASYLNRDVSFAELIALRDRITLEYVRRGFATSGAVLPDQDVKDGIVRIEVNEGYLTSVEIETDGRYKVSYLEQRIRRAAPGPVNVQELEEQLRLLQADERIASLHATLTPGEQPGESVLHIELSERRAVQFDTDISNNQSPSIGADNASLELSHVNLRGIGDEIRAQYRVSEGPGCDRGRLPLARRHARHGAGAARIHNAEHRRRIAFRYARHREPLAHLCTDVAPVAAAFPGTFPGSVGVR